MEAGVNTAQPDITEAERERALGYLVETRNSVAEAVNGLSETQWNFRPNPDSWSPAQIVEHLAIVEGRVQSVLEQLAQAAPAPGDRDSSAILAYLLKAVPDRTTKVQAPSHVLPTGQCTPDQALENFLARNDALASSLNSTVCLRGNLAPHPLFGLLNGYEWLLVTAAHNARHAKQILEVKAHAHFPV